MTQFEHCRGNVKNGGSSTANGHSSTKKNGLRNGHVPPPPPKRIVVEEKQAAERIAQDWKVSVTPLERQREIQRAACFNKEEHVPPLYFAILTYMGFVVIQLFGYIYLFLDLTGKSWVE